MINAPLSPSIMTRLCNDIRPHIPTVFVLSVLEVKMGDAQEITKGNLPAVHLRARTLDGIQSMSLVSKMSTCLDSGI